MAKAKTVFVCQNCGESFPRWQGQCSNCGEWNTLVEQVAEEKTKKGLATTRQKAVNPENIVSFSRVEAASGPKRRLSTMIGELDRVLGSSVIREPSSKGSQTSYITSGMVPGAVMLIGGEPGIGKSTLLTQMVVSMLSAQPLSEKVDTPLKPILYVCGEESPSQIAMRIKRIQENEYKNKVANKTHSSVNSLNEHLLFVTSTDVDEVVSVIREHTPQLVIIDSIQTMQTEDLLGAEGSVGQIRESAQRLTDTVKRLGIPTFLVGHVTKEGTIAGPKVLEHIVDAVLELSGERNDQLRLLRAIKNRFGATDEVGVFRLAEYGLEEVPNPSEMLLEHTQETVAGSATVCVMEGTRPLLVEVQALVVSSQLAMPRRVGRGIELSRIQVLAAVLQKHAHLALGTADIFVSAAGGFSIREPSVDLGLAMAIVSSLHNKPLPKKTIFIGEIGLLGEIRSVSYLERRIKEAKRLGFTKIISRQTHHKMQDVIKEMQV